MNIGEILYERWEEETTVIKLQINDPDLTTDVKIKKDVIVHLYVSLH